MGVAGKRGEEYCTFIQKNSGIKGNQCTKNPNCMC